MWYDSTNGQLNVNLFIEKELLINLKRLGNSVTNLSSALAIMRVQKDRSMRTLRLREKR